MSKSTPICQLPQNENAQNDPIVTDILKEIHQENKADESVANDKQKEIDYEIDSQIANTDNEITDDKDNETIEKDGVTENFTGEELPLIDDTVEIKDNDTQNLSLQDKLFLKFREPLIVFLLSILLSIPNVTKILFGIIQYQGLINHTAAVIVLKASIVAGLFYFMKKII